MKRLPNIIWLIAHYPQFAFATIQYYFCIIEGWPGARVMPVLQELLRRVIMLHVLLVLAHNLDAGGKAGP